MSEAEMDTVRAFQAAKAIADGRNLKADAAAIMVTLEHAVTVILVAFYGPQLAPAMLNEGLVPGVEERLALGAARKAAGS